MERDETGAKRRISLLKLAQRLGNVSQACRMLGYSRETFYRYKELYDKGGEEALHEIGQRGLQLRSRLAPEIEQEIVRLAVEQPGYGQVRVAKELRKQGLFISPAGVRCVWQRHNLEVFSKRLKAFEERIKHSANTPLDPAGHREEGWEAVLRRLTPGEYGIQDTLALGAVQGLGRLYQQTYIDLYTGLVFGTLYTTRTPWVAARFLQESVFPFFARENLVIQRIATDTENEYGAGDPTHGYELFLSLNKVQHERVDDEKPGVHGVIQRFHRVILGEFYQMALATRTFNTIEELQAELSTWLAYYNDKRRLEERKNALNSISQEELATSKHPVVRQVAVARR